MASAISHRDWQGCAPLLSTNAQGAFAHGA
jgi:hypothetical protein